MSDKLKMINGGKTTIYYSPGYLPRAERVACVAESMHNFMEMLFGLETPSFVMVLDEKDWVAELQTGYGVPCAAACSDEAAIYLPARYLPKIWSTVIDMSEAQIEANSETFGTMMEELEQIFFLPHEFGHGFTYVTSGGMVDLRWMDEFIAQYVAYCHMMLHAPQAAADAKARWKYVQHQPSMKCRTLTDLQKAAHGGGMTLDNYIWYLSRFGAHAADIYEVMGDEFIRQIVRQCKNRKSISSDILEEIYPSFQYWMENF